MPHQVDFDIEGAKAARFTDAEIADTLAKQANFDIGAAREAGFTDNEEIIRFLTTGERFDRRGNPLIRGVSTAIVDLATTALGGAAELGGALIGGPATAVAAGAEFVSQIGPGFTELATPVAEAARGLAA